jgi:membrane fusion protein, heavy metal efflux system
MLSFRRSGSISGKHLGVPGCLALLLLCGCHKAENTVAARVQTDPTEVAVTPAIAENLKVGVPEMQATSGVLQVPARVESDARRIARVGSPVSGRILRLLAFEGSYVRAGTVLATLHSTDLSQAQLSLVKAHAQQAVDQASAKRAEQLVAADVIGRAELERREAERLQTDAEAASYRTQLRGLGMGEGQIRQLESTGKLNAEYAIVAPRSGTLLERKITIGQVVQPADEAFTIADLSVVRIVANVPEEEGSGLRAGMPVNVHIPALPASKLSGSLSYVAPVVNPQTRTIEVRMDVPNSGGLYKPDELATMTLTGKAEPKLTVPVTAVVREENKDYVFVETGPGRFKMREVTLGDEQDERRVVQAGVTANDRIVTDGAFHLNNQRKQNAIKGGE